jgi:hypothetical protein
MSSQIEQSEEAANEFGAERSSGGGGRRLQRP